MAGGAAANLTPGPDDLANQSEMTFRTTLTTGVRPDGSALPAPMDDVAPYLARTTEVERAAMWAFLQSLSAPPGGR